MPKEEPSNDVQINLIQEKIKELIRQASLEKIQSYAQIPDFQLQEYDVPLRPGQVLAHRLALVFISGKPIRITFKVHFNHKDTREIAFRLYGVSSLDRVTEKHVIDFIKEYCNLSGGYLKKLFENIRLGLGMSLPLCMRGFDEVYSDYGEVAAPLIRFSDIWKLTYHHSSITCTSLVEILDLNALKDVTSIELVENSEDSEEIEFL